MAKTKPDPLIAKNFRFLCKYYDDNQEYLEILLGKSQSTISAYMNCKMPVPVEVLKKISTRYNVPLDVLATVDLTEEYDFPQVITIEDSKNFAEHLYPIFTSKVARENANFNRAYDKYLFAVDVDMADELVQRFGSLELAISLFQKSWDEDKIYVALVNSISCVLFAYAIHCKNGMATGQEILDKGKITLSQIQNGNLRDPRKNNNNLQYTERQRYIFDKYDSLVYESIKILKSDSQFSELGDYFMALASLIGFVEDFITYDNAICNGFGLMTQLIKLDNKYALAFFENHPILSKI